LIAAFAASVCAVEGSYACGRQQAFTCSKAHGPRARTSGWSVVCWGVVGNGEEG
jgi:hypothetical protein